MGSVLREVGDYFATLAGALHQGWVRFFFRPTDPTTLGLIRLLVGSLLVWQMLIIGLDLSDTLGSGGWVDVDAATEYLRSMRPGAWTFWTSIPDRFLLPAWILCLAIAVCFAAGLWSRWTAPLAWGIGVATSYRAPALQFGFDQILSTLIFYLGVTGSCGRAISLDRYLAFRRSVPHPAQGRGLRDPVAPPSPSVGANVGLRLIQVHLAIIYGMSGLSKLMSAEWWDGTALEMIILTPEFGFLDLSGLLRYTALIHLAAHLSVALELSYPVLIWIRQLRPLVLAAVIFLHIGIIFTLGLVEFGLSMIVANLAFIPGESLRSRAQQFQEGRRIETGG